MKTAFRYVMGIKLPSGRIQYSKNVTVLNINFNPFSMLFSHDFFFFFFYFPEYPQSSNKADLPLCPALQNS